MTDLFENETTTTTTLDMRRLQRQKRRAVRRRWTLVVVAASIVLVAIGGSIAWNFVQGLGGDGESGVADYEGAGQGAVRVVIEPGMSGAAMADVLYEAGVVASPESFVTAYTENPDAQQISAGYYLIQREMKADFAVDALLDPGNRVELTINVPEGKTLDTYFEKIANLTKSTPEEVEEVASDHDAIGLPEEANGNLEGWLFPATYAFDPGVEPVEILSTMVAQTVKVLERNGVAPEDWEQTLTVASIVEGEASRDEDRPLVASVIYNRLDDGMKLQMDSTVKYVVPGEGAFATSEELKVDSPYNTYEYAGLPPGPINAPSESAIQAANSPADSNYLFFVTVNFDTGETKFSETHAEFLEHKAEMNEWIAENTESTDEG
ncbi:endolytic transglycosylase MltG [Demequina sp. B12]|uniref:endolytic transglycosylase MltG n=1 Tax=Demequina sp. B12 TaxID=2992757 RepID=UPI00237A4E64|nr:endolytic transglycosylase MltG [Demequina sp. B12]MDE0573037.1 endolytic transglycosylase MltG [Demequina sp. B12]